MDALRKLLGGRSEDMTDLLTPIHERWEGKGMGPTKKFTCVIHSRAGWITLEPGKVVELTREQSDKLLAWDPQCIQPVIEPALQEPVGPDPDFVPGAPPPSEPDPGVARTGMMPGRKRTT